MTLYRVIMTSQLVIMLFCFSFQLAFTVTLHYNFYSITLIFYG